PTPTPDGSWSAWSAVVPSSGSPITSPGMRYLQYRADFSSNDNGGTTPRLDDVTVKVGVAPAQLAFIPPQVTSVGAGVCSGAITVEAQDTQGETANVTSDIAVALGTSSVTGQFFSDAACTAPIAGFTLVAPATSGAVYYLDTTAAVPTLTASSAG